MTLIGKLLALLNLLVGLGLLTWGTTTFFLRPGYFDAPPEVVDKGNTPVTFKGSAKEVDAAFRQANLASGAWGEGFKALADLEDRRDARRAAYKTRLKWAESGNPDDRLIGFYKEADPGVLPKGGKFETPVEGPDNLPLKGASVLEKQLADDVAAVAKLAEQVEQARKRYAALGLEIVRNEARLWAMTTIRDDVQAEAFYLAAVEVNVYETRETVFRRKRQLDRRLAELGVR